MVDSQELMMVLSVFVLSRCALVEPTTTSEAKCLSSPQRGSDRTVNIAMNIRRNETGEWLDTFVAEIESSNSSDHLHLDLTHRVQECEGRRYLYIKGVTKDASKGENGSKYKFYPRTGKNIAVSNKGLTVQRINVEEPINAVALTSQPLRDNEIFEIRVDKKLAKWNTGTGIGVTPIAPADIDILAEMYKSPNVWMQYNTNVHSNGKIILAYKAKDMNKLQVGDRIGVMRTEFGVLHFFVNGVDQGPAIPNIPVIVYGVIDLRHDDIQATIVDANKSS